MKYGPDKRRRRSIRLRGHDYSQPGAFFVTMCTRDRECLFGDVADGRMRPNHIGMLVAGAWNSLHDDDRGIALDAFIVMPNHVHGIIVITNVGAIHESPLQKSPAPTSTDNAIKSRRRILIPVIIGRFKMTSAKRINELRATLGRPVWQRNYCEHIILTDESLARIRRYIVEIPARWLHDRENPATKTVPSEETWAV